MGYTAPGLRVSDGIHLSLRGKRVFAHKLAGLIDRALNWTRRTEGDNTRLANDQLWGDTPRFEGQGASEGPQSVALRHAGYTAAHLRSYGDEPGAPELVKVNRETPVKYLKGIKGRSSKKLTWLTAQMKCLYTNTHSMGNKQEETEATMLLESYDLIAITET